MATAQLKRSHLDVSIALLPVARAELIALQGIEHPEHLSHIAADPALIDIDPLDDAMRVDNEGSPQAIAFRLLKDAQLWGQQLSGNQWILKILEIRMVLPPGHMGILVVGGATHHFRIPPRTQSERDHQLRVQSERMDRERCVKAVTAHSDDAKIRGVRSVSVDVLPCNPAGGVAETIVEYCDMKRADLVVVGSRGAGSLRRSMLSLVGLGSVSEHLARHLTSAALMIVKRPPVVSTTAGATHGNDSEMQKLEEEEAKTSSSA